VRWFGVAAMATLGLAAGAAVQAAPADTASAPVTFTKDIAPILQRSCQNCHRPDGVAPMSLVTYEDVRPYARAIKQRTSIGPHRGVMPPWYIEKNVGIQQYKNDPSLSDAEIAMIGRWADNGAPRGNPADMPPPRKFDSLNTWAIGTPDLVVSTKEILV
jgi:mono/diheme cytochrome c family protein